MKEDKKISNRIFNLGDDDKVSSFKCTEPFLNSFYLRYMVDDHNNVRHARPSLEETCVDERWAVRVFSFLLVVTETILY